MPAPTLLSSLANLLTGPHGVNRYLEQVDPTLARDRRLTTILQVRPETHDTATIAMRAPRGWDGHVAGQHVEIGIEINGVRHVRCFTLSSSAHRDDELTITVKANPAGTVSQHLVHVARPGDRIELSPAAGDFRLPAGPLATDVLLVSGGSGITPAAAMLRTMIDDGRLIPRDTPRPTSGRVAMLHYARSSEDLILRRELEAWAGAFTNLDITVILTSEHGRFTPEHAAGLAVDLDAATTWVCGPEALVDAVTDWAPAERLHVERFHPPTPAPLDGPATGEIRLSASQQQIVNDGRAVLAQAEAAGLTPASGCRMGICHTCTRQLTAGTVRDLRSGHTTCGDVTGGTEIQICVSAPVGDVTIDL